MSVESVNLIFKGVLNLIREADVAGPEAEFEPGSHGRVLRNRLGITSVRALERKESEELLATTQQLIDEVTIDHRFTANDVRGMHRRWLGEIYE
jgi:cell filamentation protein